MKLRARVTRTDNGWGKKTFKAVYPKGVNPTMMESILQRNLGPRPYGKLSMMCDGETICVWFN